MADDFDVVAVGVEDEPGVVGRMVVLTQAGRPVVATAVGGIPEAIADGENGWLVPSGDPVALATRLGSALDDPTARSRIAACACATARERFGVRQQSKAYRALFQTLAR